MKGKRLLALMLSAVLLAESYFGCALNVEAAAGESSAAVVTAARAEGKADVDDEDTTENGSVSDEEQDYAPVSDGALDEENEAAANATENFGGV